jgi:NAD(P)-dependent dehydrogenase (short-subunit alcohol dehydrogenase family)
MMYEDAFMQERRSSTWQGFEPEGTSTEGPKHVVFVLPKFRTVKSEMHSSGGEGGTTTRQQLELFESVDRLNDFARSTLLPQWNERHSISNLRVGTAKRLRRTLRYLTHRERQFVLARLDWIVLVLAGDDLVLERCTVAKWCERYEAMAWCQLASATPPVTQCAGYLFPISGAFDGDWNFTRPVLQRRLDVLFQAQGKSVRQVWEVLQTHARAAGLVVVLGPTACALLCSNKAWKLHQSQSSDRADATRILLDVYLVGASSQGTTLRIPQAAGADIEIRRYATDVTVIRSPQCELSVHSIAFNSVDVLALAEKLDLVCDVFAGDVFATPAFLLKRACRRQQAVALRAPDGSVPSPLVIETGTLVLPVRAASVPVAAAVERWPRCYHCNNHYWKDGTDDTLLHYSQMCVPCARFNHALRTACPQAMWRQRETPPIALVTGGRSKIGYATCLRLLRGKVRVVTTTRFPANALYRYQQESDWAEFAPRLEIFQLDLRNIGRLQAFTAFLSQHLPYLTLLVNNAAQTFTYDEDYYDQMYAYERSILQPPAALSAPDIDDDDTTQQLVVPSSASSSSVRATDRWLSALDCVPKNMTLSKWTFSTDRFGELITQGGIFWTQPIEAVSALQLVETSIVNLTAPTLLVSQLRALLRKQGGYVVNVVCREGTFQMHKQNAFHAHTNACKAGLNMLTRTLAEDFWRTDRIHVASVDPGWISCASDTNRACPLDCEDAAARILQPIQENEQGRQADSAPVGNGMLWRHGTPTQTW